MSRNDQTINRRRPQQQQFEYASSLDENTPCGLFEALNGARYLVTEIKAEGVRLAITLTHLNFKPFTVHELTEKRIDRGLWLGRYRLRLTNLLGFDTHEPNPGTISIMPGGVAIYCCPGWRDARWIPLGSGGDAGRQVCAFYDEGHCDFAGWAIEAAGAAGPFCEQWPPIEPRWLLDMN